MAADAWLVVGLGNPGDRYAATRHNVGQMVVDALAARMGEKFRRHPRASAIVAEGRAVPGGPKLVLAKSNGYMNTSGGPVSQLAQYHGVPTERVIVVHDDLDLPFDSLKLTQGGGHGGHNGLRDIISSLGNQNNFYRLRLGIGHPGHSSQVTGYVLGRAPRSEQELIDSTIDFSLGVLPDILEGQLSRAMQQLHSFKA